MLAVLASTWCTSFCLSSLLSSKHDNYHFRVSFKNWMCWHNLYVNSDWATVQWWKWARMHISFRNEHIGVSRTKLCCLVQCFPTKLETVSEFALVHYAPRDCQSIFGILNISSWNEKSKEFSIFFLIFFLNFRIFSVALGLPFLDPPVQEAWWTSQSPRQRSYATQSSPQPALKTNGMEWMEFM